MRVFAIADPHLSRTKPKPMTIFGEGWTGHPERFFGGWRDLVGDNDLVLVPGDVSWAMTLDGALPDLHDLAALPGQKVLLRGNHDYWWPSLAKLRAALPVGMFAVQNDALRLGSVVVAGTRGWVVPGSGDFSAEDEKIYRRELGRLTLSLTAAHKLRRPGDRFVVMLHYPPTNLRLEPSGFTELLASAGADALVFGHLHGERRAVEAVGDTPAHLVAADALGFVPKLILEAL
ncbi:MAG: phosphohydrolase [uncultured Truepera sp.]|uniref:Phosphohydrolase n=1 Tax=uncultured Truepera sp. TaxID=543023 RepID=A0A6J4VRA1_9DEIN|nr:MAG: phosphohydrolase [uncultured Truepera sp.]